jgi:hypothetical protein
MLFKYLVQATKFGHRMNTGASTLRNGRAQRPLVEVLEGRALLTGSIQYGPATASLALDTPAAQDSSQQNQQINSSGALESSYVNGIDDSYANASIGPGGDSSYYLANSQFDLSLGVESFYPAGYPPFSYPTNAVGSYRVSGTIQADPKNPNAIVYVEVDVYWTPFSSYNRGQTNNLPSVQASFTLQGSEGQAASFSGSDTNSTPGDNTQIPTPTILAFKPGDTFTFTMTGSLSTSVPDVQGGGELGVGLNVVPQSALPQIETSSLSWDDQSGGVDFGYQVTGTLPANSAVDFYWASGPSAADELESQPLYSSPASGLGSGSYGIFNVPASSLGTPPAGAEYLLAVAHAGPANPQTDSVMSLAYDPEVTITAKYNGSSDPGTIGRFLAIPGLLSDEVFTTTLSDSLAALRPQVEDLVGGQILLTQPNVDSSGNWDGKTYVAAFDPGTLSAPTPMTALAEIGDQPLADDQVNIDVQPLPSWYSSLSDASVKFDPVADLYTLSGTAANLNTPSDGDIIPSDVPIIGGQQNGASLGIIVSATAPLSVSSSPQITATDALTITIQNTTVLQITVSPSYEFNPDGPITGSFSVGGGSTLNPETLEMDGGLSMTIDADVGYKATLPLIPSGLPSVVGIFLVTYELDLINSISVGAHVVLNFPSTGQGSEIELGAGSYLQLQDTASLRGQIDIGWFVPPQFLGPLAGLLNTRVPGIFGGSSLALPALDLELAITGSVSLHVRATYSGNPLNPVPTLGSFGGSVNAQVAAQLQFIIGNENLLGTSPFTIQIFPGTLPYVFGDGP